MFSLTKSEMEIMCQLWLAKRPLSKAELLETAGEKSWKDSSVHILLNSMLDKGAIEIAGFTKTGSHYGRTFAPTMTEAGYAMMQIKNLPNWEKNPKEATKTLLSALAEEVGADASDLESLSRFLEDA